jgi:hypothetical protein
MNNLDIVQEAYIGSQGYTFADSDNFIYLNNGDVEVVIRFPYCVKIGNSLKFNPHYGVARGNSRFMPCTSFVEAMDKAALFLR